jgi:hypothetical protein
MLLALSAGAIVRGLRRAQPGLSMWLAAVPDEAHVRSCDKMQTCYPCQDAHGDMPEAQDEGSVIAPKPSDHDGEAAPAPKHAR